MSRLKRRLVAASRVDAMLPRDLVVQPVGADVARIAVMEHLAHPGDVVAVVHEHLRQRHHVGQSLPKMVLQVEHPRGVGAKSGEQRRAAWAAQRELAVGMVEPHAVRGKAVDIGRLHQRMPVAAQVVVHVVHGDEQHVGLGRGGFCRSHAAVDRCGQNGRPTQYLQASQNGIRGHGLGRPSKEGTLRTGNCRPKIHVDAKPSLAVPRSIGK